MSASPDPRIKRLAATILVCGTALAVDKFVLGPPAGAAATEAAPPPAPETTIAGDADADANSGPAASPAPTPTSEPMDARRRLADRLGRMEPIPAGGTPAAASATDADHVPSLQTAFGDPADWWCVDTPHVVPDEDLDGLRAAFERSARLTAVVHAADGLGGAQINGRFVPLGGVVGGFRLIAIGSRSVILTGSGGRVVLEMDVPRIDTSGVRDTSS